MRLKSITLTGFKSFVDRTQINLPKQITAIVGPNGCGKSNTIDAVRWVMGESSAKYLRGESMADVIFNGSVHRAPIAQASIDLHFDNTAGRLGGAYASYDELAIRRQVTRDGQSHYYLNGSRCRRKDITDIFLGTGLGPRSYAIIEQGTISRLIEAKPEEFRVFLEEAAGISRYKERRKETEQRIEHTRDNLMRINDVREELGKQIAHLERQAKTAEKYKEYKTEERLLRAQLFVWRSQQLQNLLQQHQLKISELQTEIKTQEQSYATLNEQWQTHFDQQYHIQKTLEAKQSEYADLNTAVKVCMQTIAHTENQQTQFEHELKQIVQQQKEADNLNTLDSSTLEQLNHDLANIQNTIQYLQKELETRQNAYTQAAAEKNQWQKEWQEINTELAAHTQTAQVEQTRLQHIEQRLAQLIAQQKKLHEEKRLFTTEEDEILCNNLQKQLDELETLRVEHQTTLNQHQLLLNDHQIQQQVIQEKTNHTRHQLQQLDGKLTALNTLQAQALGRNEQNMQTWLQQHALQDTERLANIIEVAPEFEQHLENYLGEKLQAIPLPDFNSLDTLLTDLPDTILHFIHTEKNNNHTTNHLSPISLASKVKAPPALLKQLENVYCANHLSEGLQLIHSLPAGAEVITPDGLLIQQHWIQIRRGKDEQSGILQRKREIVTLQKDILLLTQELENLIVQQQQIEQATQVTEEQKQQTQKTCQEIEQQKHQLQTQWQVQQANIKQKGERLQKLCQELDAAATEHKQLETQYQSIQILWQTALEKVNQLNQKKENLTNTQSQFEQALQQTNQLLRETQEAIHQQNIKQQKCTTEHQGLLLQNQRTHQQLSQLQQRQATVESHLSQLKPALQQAQTEMIALNNQLQQAEAIVTDTKNTLTETEQLLRHTETERQAVAAQLEQLKQQVSNEQIQAEHAQTKNNSILEQFASLDLVFEEIAAQLSEDFLEEVSQSLLENIQNKISRLGAINLAAANELTELTERKQFIDKQYDDLVEALNTLEAAIQEIDQETKAKFQETFDTVNQHFKQLFPKIFAGGQAYLSLTSDNILETGVIVFAQPPGKRNSTIHLLSGGEKALTALALVFAIFELNPAPFCMLDEVDAPLDDVNVGRFCNLVKTMAAHTQFVLVTHNKLAMEMADQLMGVTMQEPGVSRLVAVDVEAAIAMAVHE